MRAIVNRCTSLESGADLVKGLCEVKRDLSAGNICGIWEIEVCVLRRFDERSKCSRRANLIFVSVGRIEDM